MVMIKLTARVKKTPLSGVGRKPIGKGRFSMTFFTFKPFSNERFMSGPVIASSMISWEMFQLPFFLWYPLYTYCRKWGKNLVLSVTLSSVVILGGCEQDKVEADKYAAELLQIQTAKTNIEKDLEDIRKDLSAVKQERNKLQEQIKANKAKIGGLGLLLHNSLEETKKLTADLVNTQSERDKLKGDLSKTSQSLNKSQTELSSITEELDKLKDDFLKASESLKKTEADLSVVTQERNTLTDDFSKTSESLNKVQTELSAIIKERDKLKDDFSKTSKLLSKVGDELSAVKQERDKVKGDLLKTSERLNKATAEVVKLRQDLVTATQIQDKLQMQGNSDKAIIADLEKNLKNVTAEYAEQAKNNSALEIEIQKLKATIEELKKQIEKKETAPQS